MSNLVQRIKINNAFVRRDYWIVMPVVILCAMQAHIAILRHVRHSEHWAINLFTLCFFSFIILLPAFYHRLALQVTAIFFVLCVISCSYGMDFTDRVTAVRVGITISQFGILTAVQWIRAARTPRSEMP